jgi:hypothetical protein
MSADTSLTFYLMNDWTNNYISLSDGNTIDSNHDTIKVYSFNRNPGNNIQSLPELDLSHIYLHLDLSSTIAYDYVRKMMTDKEGLLQRIPT